MVPLLVKNIVELTCRILDVGMVDILSKRKSSHICSGYQSSLPLSHNVSVVKKDLEMNKATNENLYMISISKRLSNTIKFFPILNFSQL